MTLNLKSRIGPKGQVVIPKPIRESFGLEPGGVVCFCPEGDELKVRKEADAEVLERLFSGEKMKIPDNIDWDKLLYSQFKE